MRKRQRLRDYDYGQAGYYFVTICTHNRTHLLWESGRAGLEPAPTNRFGDIVSEVWLDLPRHNAGIQLDRFVVMPNHIHGILAIGDVGAGSKPARVPTLTEVVRQLETFSAQRINALRGTPARPVWQRSFYDHIIRGEDDYLRIWDYIDRNPAKWREDCYYKEE